ncbi:hypothetical protein [Ruegeria sp. THAF33]|uniref:hypothetical protein n=1 Tax=Ruegeria sp. THAF33 TaxID=2587853 RepID=UPI00126799B6|nr:hypothetical protein [Ruegeria sp. THAF33]QFT74024.1 hypothetical protein FIU92_13380 [Ruegeria sp. THAF33]
MTSKTNTTPQPLTDDAESWKRTLSILAGIRQVAKEMREEAEQIEVAHPNQMRKPGYGERVDIVSILNKTYAFMSTDIRRVARSSSLTMPEDLC